MKFCRAVLTAFTLILFMVTGALAGDWADVAETSWWTSNPDASTFTISTPQQLAGLAVIVNSSDGNGISFSNKTIKLSNDIDLSGREWRPIGSSAYEYFAGVFDGGGHKITGMSVTAQTYTNVGLFGYISGSSSLVENVNVSGDISSNADNIGGVVGQTATNGKVKNSSFIGTISVTPNVSNNRQHQNTGGVVGWSTSDVVNCVNSGDITNSSIVGVNVSTQYENIGGVVGRQSGRLEHSSNFGKITIDRQPTSTTAAGYWGGVVGYSTADVVACLNYGEVSVVSKMNAPSLGGIAGHADGLATVLLRDSRNFGKISGKSIAGISIPIGGVVGSMSGNPKVLNCSNNGDVSGDGLQLYLGGIAGLSTGTVANCVNYGAVTADHDVASVSSAYMAHVGGIIGFATAGSLDNCFNSGAITSKKTQDSTGTLSFWNGGIAGRVSVNVESITNSSSTGTLNVTVPSSFAASSHLYVGGVVGENVGAVINSSSASGAITVPATTHFDNTYAVGGVVGELYGGSIANSQWLKNSFNYAAGKISNNGTVNANVVSKDANLMLPVGVIVIPSAVSLNVSESKPVIVVGHPSGTPITNWVGTAVASFSSNVMTAGSTEGTGTFRATVNSVLGGGLASADCVVSVSNPNKVTSVTLTPKTLSLAIGSSDMLAAAIEPASAAGAAVTWETTSSDVASVDISGNVTARAEGIATITATAGGQSDSCTVTVFSTKIPVTSVGLSQTTANLNINATLQLTATVLPGNATFPKITWSSSNGAVATASDGKVTAHTVGSATITATADGKSADCVVTVTKVAVTGVTLNKTTATLELYEPPLKLTATVAPDNASFPHITWSSSSDDVAAVSDGEVTARAPGTANITASADGKIATCVVTVNVPVTSVSFDKSVVSIEVGSLPQTLAYTVAPSNAGNKAVTWSSGTPAVATIDASGRVTAVSIGRTTIIVRTVSGGKTDTCYVEVFKTPPIPPTPKPDKPVGTPTNVESKQPNVQQNIPKDEEVAAVAAAAKAMSFDIGDLKVEDGVLVVNATTVGKLAQQTDPAKIIPLPVFSADLNTAGDVAMVAFAVSGDKLMATTPDKVKIMKVLSGSKGEFFTYQSEATKFADKVFTIMHRPGGVSDDVFTGTIMSNGSYKLVLFIQDGGSFDLDGAKNNVVLDPAAIVGTSSAPAPTPKPNPGNDSGCNVIGTPLFWLLMAAPLVFVRRKK